MAPSQFLSVAGIRNPIGFPPIGQGKRRLPLQIRLFLKREYWTRTRYDSCPNGMAIAIISAV